MSARAHPKSMAKALRKALAERNLDLPHSVCLEIVARQFGVANWNTLKAESDKAASLSFTLFVEHGRQEEAATFYRAALGAVRTKTHYVQRQEPMAVDLELGGLLISICGSNPRREAEPWRGGPFFAKEKGAGSAVYRLEVDNVAAVLKTAVAAGANIRDGLQVADNGHRVATIFDPFGHIWALHEKTAVTTKQAA